MSYSKNALLNFEEKYVLGPINPKTGTNCWDWIGATDPVGGYGYFKWGGVQGYAHRFAWLMWRGEIADGFTVDHDDPNVGCGRPQCVNPDHLALATKRQQRQRQRKTPTNNTSGHTNVFWVSSIAKWKVVVVRNGVKYGNKTFSNVEDAAAAAKQLRQELKEMEEE